MLERSGRTIECTIETGEGKSRYKVDLEVCTSPTCICDEVHLQLRGQDGAAKEDVVVALGEKGLAEKRPVTPLARQLVGALTDDDWKYLDDYYLDRA